MGLFDKSFGGEKKKTAIVIILVILFIIMIFSVIIVLPIITLHSEFPDEVMAIKESGNVICVYVLVKGTVNPNDPQWKEETIRVPISQVSGFYASETGHIFIPAHGLIYDEKADEEAIKESLLGEYIMKVKWFGENRYNDYSWNEYHTSDEFEKYLYDELYNASWIKDERELEFARQFCELKGNTTITNIDTSYKLFSPGMDKMIPFNKDKIVYIDDIEVITDAKSITKDIAVIQSPQKSSPFIIFNGDFQDFKEGTKLYIIRYGEVLLTDYMGEVEAPAYTDYDNLVDEAYEMMRVEIKDRGADIESGYLGSSTSRWPYLKKGSPKVYRFTGHSPPGCSGSPVLDEKGHCVGMVVCGSSMSSVYFYPFEVLEKASEGFDLVVYKSLSDKLREYQIHLIIAIVLAIVFAIAFGYGFEKIKRRKH